MTGILVFLIALAAVAFVGYKAYLSIKNNTPAK